MKTFLKNLMIILLVQLITGLVLAFWTSTHPETATKLAANFLIHEDQLTKADAIVILGGFDTNKRLDQGVNLYNEGYAPFIIHSCGGSYHAAEKRFMNEGLSEAVYSLEAQSTSTYENALFTKDIVLANGYQSLILVTTPQQSKRAKYIFNKVFKDTDVVMMSSLAQGTVFDPEKVMESKAAQTQLVEEFVKLIYYYFKYMFV